MFPAELFENTEKAQRREFKSPVILPLRETPSSHLGTQSARRLTDVLIMFLHPHTDSHACTLCVTNCKPAGIPTGVGGQQIYLFTF